MGQRKLLERWNLSYNNSAFNFLATGKGASKFY